MVYQYFVFVYLFHVFNVSKLVGGICPKGGKGVGIAVEEGGCAVGEGKAGVGVGEAS